MSDHNHEDPLDSILNGNNEATEDNASTNTPDLSPGLIDTVTTKKLFQLFQNFIHSHEDTAENTGTSAAYGGHKCAEELEQDYKKGVQMEPPTDQRLANCFRILHGEFLNKKSGTRW